MMHSEPNNADRAGWARNAADTFAMETYGGRSFERIVAEQPTDKGDAYCIVQDLVADLMHLARRHGWNPIKIIENARWHFECEEEEEREGLPPAAVTEPKRAES